VKQSEVVSIATDAPLRVRLEGGTVIQGTLSSPGGGGAVAVSGPAGTINSTIDKVLVTWEPGSTDPEILALQHNWAYEVAADISGKTGNTKQMGTAFSARAVQSGPTDTLQFYVAYNREKTMQETVDAAGNTVETEARSADQFKAGVDFSNNFSGRFSWYTRDEGGFDRVKDIDVYNIAAAGLGYDFVKRPGWTLTGRGGISFRYENYKNPLTEDVKASGLDIGLINEYKGEFWSMVNRLSWVPLFEDFANYRFLHESYLELPMADPKWKARFGVANDFNSKPAPGLEEMDTTFFARFVLSFK